MVTVQSFDTREWVRNTTDKIKYVNSEPKVKFCFFILSPLVWIFIGMEIRYLSIDCIKICSNSKRTKTNQNEVIQPTTSNNGSRPIVPKPCLQPPRFWQACY